MDNFVDYSGQAAYQDTADIHQNDSQKPAFFHQQMPCDIKPRLTKEQHDILETEFLKQHKPNTITKKRFAESLGVSLDKVNVSAVHCLCRDVVAETTQQNWFQNRRAKSKQDAKKQQGHYQFLTHQQTNQQPGYSSDSDTSPAYPATDYFDMMQQCASDDRASNGLGISQPQQYQDQCEFEGLPYSNSSSGTEQFHNFEMPQQVSQDMFDSPQELNRRTLTQDQFDAFARSGSMMTGAENYELFQSGFTTGQDVLNEIFPAYQNTDFKQQPAFAFQDNVPPSMSSHDSSVTSSVSDISRFPSASSMQDQSNTSATSSEWDGSRSSSVYQDDPYLQMSAQSQQPTSSASQWQPGQSVPVDINALNQEFRQVAQARQHLGVHEQPLAWPADEAFARRESSASTLAQSMSTVGIHTPHPQHQATFKSPAPPANIAARRQRPRPAGLHLGNMRSQSYSGVAPLGSPGQAQQQSLNPGQPLRRIRSTNFPNGVAQGRVQKLPGSAQRSPLAFTFADAMNSPKAFRHMSSQSGSNLAPPTPMSPNEFPRAQNSAWQTSSHVSRQPSISETDLEHGVPYAQAVPAQSQTFSSPPHTPMYHQQGFVQQRVGNHVITENTPPQSAPASQQCFPSNTFSMSQQQLQPPPPAPSQAPPQQMQAFAPPQQPQFMNVMVPDQHSHAPNATYAPTQHYMVPTSDATASLPMQYPHAVPIVNAQGELQMVYASHLPFMQQATVQQPHQPQYQHMHTPPQGQCAMFTTSTATPNIQVTASAPKPPAPQPAAEFFVHEYSPPQDLKRAATPRRNMVDNGPKNYTFANHTSEHFEKGKKESKKAADAKASSSPASSVAASS